MKTATVQTPYNRSPRFLLVHQRENAYKTTLPPISEGWYYGLQFIHDAENTPASGKGLLVQKRTWVIIGGAVVGIVLVSSTNQNSGSVSSATSTNRQQDTTASMNAVENAVVTSSVNDQLAVQTTAAPNTLQMQKTTNASTRPVSVVNVSAPSQPSSLAPISLSGNGQTATSQFTLQQGLSIITLHNSGQSNFIVDLLDDNGNEVANLSNAIGDYSGSVAVQISGAGNYLLNVQSDGPWTINITQPRTNTAPATSNFSAIGDEATAFFALSSGLHTFYLNNNGDGNFIVDLLDQNGNEVNNLENVIGDFSGSTAVHIDTSGIYLLNIVSGDGRSSGNWSITIR